MHTRRAYLMKLAALAASPGAEPMAKVPETSAQVFAAVVRQSIGAPLLADIGDQATGRIYIRVEEGGVAWVDRGGLQTAAASEELVPETGIRPAGRGD